MLAEMAKSPEILKVYCSAMNLRFIILMYLYCMQFVKMFTYLFQEAITNYHLNFPFAIYFSFFLQPVINNQLIINKVTYKQWCLDMCSDHAWGDQIAATILR